MAGKATPTVISTDLREDFALSLAALPAGQKRVDREKKILHGVLMLGRKSGNTHGVEDVDGTDYDDQAIREALAMYEGKPGYADHPPRNDPTRERSVYDALGIHHNVRETPEGMVSDFHLQPAHKLCESLLNSAENEKLAGLYAFSHNARGQGEVRGRRYVVTKITEARSGDVVAKGATTRNLFESPEPPTMTTPAQKTTLGKIVLESKLPATGTGLTKALLLEQDDMMGAQVDAEGDHKDDLVAAIAKLVKSDKAEDHALASKILKMLKPDCKIEGDKPAETPLAADDKAMKESADLSVKIITAVGLKAEGPLLEAMNLVPGLDGKLSMLKTLKEAAATITPTKPGTKPPPGQAKNGGTLPASNTLLESKAFDDLLPAWGSI